MIKHAFFWLILTLIAMFILPAFISASSYQARFQKELAMLEHTFGERAAKQIMGITDNMYASIFEDSGFRSWTMDMYYVSNSEIAQGESEGGIPTGKAAGYSQNYLVSLFINFYELTFRLTQMGLWFIYTLPFVLAAVVDGLMQRQVKMASFIYSSPSVFNAAWHTLILIIFLGVCYFNTPFAVPPIIFPFLSGLMAFTLRLLLSNLQRSA